ncbi:mucin-1 isoform X5 [Cebus imitator]|uniref:mucin-1 isoform X5 n=1 Tax=Cebus imitator TaxID=2715852 RepID=UPI0018978375|nr:mucin-1 isoform X5 [Cebus imitator]
MTPGIQSPFFLLLLLIVLTAATGSGHASFTEGGEKTGTTHRNSAPSSTRNVVSVTSSGISSHSPGSGSSTIQGQNLTPALATTLTSGLAATGGQDVSLTPASGSTTAPAHHGTSATDTGPASGSTTAPAHHSSSAMDTGPASGSTTAPAHHGTSATDTGPASGSTTAPAHGSTTTPAHHGTSASGSTSGSASTLVHNGTSAAETTTIPGSKSTPFSTPSHHSDTPATLASHSTKTVASSTHHSIVPPLTSSNHSTSPQLSIGVSFFFLSFRIFNLQFNSSLGDPNTNYYQELRRNISELFLQIYKQEDFLGLFNIKFRPGSVVVESTLAFREGTTSVQDVETQFDDRKEEAVSRYDLNVSAASVRDVPFPVSSPSGAGVPGWGIALLVLVCVLVALAVIYLVALAVWQCRRKNYGQLDIFPARDAYHPMSEYPTYHTHGRYVPPGSTNRSPYEEVSAGNGGSSLSYTNPAVAATSANL